MDAEVIRHLVFEALNENPKTQFANVLISVGVKAYEKELQRRPGYSVGADGRANLVPEDQERIREAVWALIIEGVLVPGLDNANESWPFLRVTEYGRAVLAAGRSIPHDPDGFLADLRNRVPGLASVVELYVSESLQCFLRGTYMASAVMLGVASEAAVLQLVEAAAMAIADAGGQARFRRVTANFFVAKKFEALRGLVPAFRDRLPDDIRRDLDVMLDGSFTLIRNFRNDAGHPTGKVVAREECFAYLQLFKGYCKRVYDLTAWLQHNRI